MLASLAVLSFLLLLLYIYWLGRRYKNNKKHQKESEKNLTEWTEYIPVNDEYKYPPVFIKIKKIIPFCPDQGQIVYIENKYNEPLNNYISKEYAKIEEFLATKGYTFIYLPQFINKIAECGIEIVKYAYPRLTDTDILPQDGDFSRLVAENIFSFVEEPVHLNGGLIRYKKTEENHHIFSYYQFENFEDDEIWEQFRAYLSSVGDGYDGPLYSLRIPEKNEEADFAFPTEAEKLIDEIKERIEQLRQTGIGEMVIKSLFKFDHTVKLSKLIITNDYRIVLPDYNNMEITMTPLPKAVFLLYLKHPEGIMFKHLVDYRNELMDLYMRISNRVNLNDMRKSINDITDPTKNAINEKCSRIREAFVGKFDESLAQNYFITGLRLEPKRITLDRKLVVWE